MATDFSLSLESLAQRIAELEREVALLRRHDSGNQDTKAWLSQLMGSFKDDPEFVEILRLGREYRAAQQDESP